ncbi:MAG: hypothetical protein WBQ09_15670 [Terriglobales bacterium]
MRTTLTIDEDVARLLEREQRRSGKSFKQVINDFLRLGLTVKQPLKKPFKVTPINLGLPHYDKVEDLLDSLEGPDHR